MKEIILEIIKFAKDKGLGDVCLLVAVLALLASFINSMGYEPLNFSKGVIKEVRAEVKEFKEGSK